METPTQTPKVYAAISAVSAALAANGIPKAQQNKQQGFKFRGIDDLYAALAPELSKNRLVIIPRYTTRAVTEQESRSGGKLFHVCVEGEFDLVCAADGSKHTARAFGESMDAGDKGTGKAISMAFKSLCFQLFCIPCEGLDNDPDASTYRVASTTATQAPPSRPMGQAPPKPSRMTADEAEEAERTIDEAFADRGISPDKARSIKIGLLQARKFSGVADASREFVDRFVNNIRSGMYDGQNGSSAKGFARTAV